MRRKLATNIISLVGQILAHSTPGPTAYQTRGHEMEGVCEGMWRGDRSIILLKDGKNTATRTSISLVFVILANMLVEILIFLY